MAESDGPLHIPGHNNVTYGPVPKADQVFHIELLDVSPSTIHVDQRLFMFLQGEIPPSKQKDLVYLDDLLNAAALSITVSGTLSDGKHEEPKTFILPFRTTTLSSMAHLSIRDSTGTSVDHLSRDGRNDILADSLLPGILMQAGTWNFEVVARLGDGTCLFAISLTQELAERL